MTEQTLTGFDRALDSLRDVVPETVEGYRQIRAVVESDGALDAPLKALLVAAAAAALGHPALAERELRRGRELGLTDERVTSAAAMLLLSRGEGVFERFMAAAGPFRAAGAPRPADERDGERYFLDYNKTDTLPPRVATLRDGAPTAFEGYHRMHHAALSADPDAAFVSELVCCTLNAAALRGDFVAVHAAGARRAGATREQLVEALVCAIPVGGVAAWAAACEALD